MGVILSSILHTKEPDVKVPEVRTLSDKHIEIIVETWKIPAAKMIDSGEAILYRYFEKYPENQNKFVAFKNVPLLTLKVSERLLVSVKISEIIYFKLCIFPC
jgi:hypothetical protein